LEIVRPTVVFGEKNRGNVYTLIDQIRRKRFVMVGDGSNRKSMCYVGNLVPFLCRFLFAAGTTITNYVDKPDLTSGELVGLIRSELDIRTPLLRVPYRLGLVGGYAFDSLARVTRRRFPISRVRVEKFCANTQVSMREPPDGFVPPFTLEQGICRMIESLG
jgi:nucleoside-diphosphate-sugar epimerase